MDEQKPQYTTIDEYIALFPQDVQDRLQTLRRTIREAAPEAIEKLSWQMPTFYLFGNLAHFAMGKHHVGFYPGASGVEHFAEELTGYKTSKGAIQFPLDRPTPYDLVARIVRFRVEENLRWEEEKRMQKTKKKVTE